MLLERLPLRDVTWKSPISSSFITINRLPLRFLPSDAGLFKDTDHPYRWFLSQYAGIYLLVAETLESYKTQRQKVRKWIDTQNVPKGSLGKTYWILVYVTLGNYPVASYQKVFTRISGDFYADRSGDRSVMIHLPPDGLMSQAANNGSSMSISAFSTMNRGDNGLSDFMAKVREGIVLAFPHRSLLYDGEIRRLDLGRSTPQQYDFKQLFLVKESFALFYQMMQLLDMALGQYEELELMMSFAPTSTLPETQWPYRPPESLKAPDPNSNPTTLPTPTTPVDNKDIMSDVVKNGEDVVTYSMNVARMKVLKSKMSLRELYRYVFARQMFYLVSLQRPVECVIKSKLFLENISSILLKEIDKNHAEVSVERTTKTIMLSVWCLAASIKCMRVCRDLVDRIISIDGNGGNGVSGLESSQSISSILNVMKMSSYQQSNSYSNNFESSEIKELDNQQILRPESSSALRMSSTVNKEKLAGFKEVFATLSELLDFAFTHYRRITPVSRFATKAGYKIIQPADAGSNNGHVVGYFSVFQTREVSARLSKEWNNFSANISGNVDVVLSSIAQRIRSASRYWAKLLSVSNNDRNLVKLEPNFIEESVYLEVLASCQLQSQQYEKGRILEVSLAALLHHTAADLHALSDRKQSLVSARLRQVEIFTACSFYTAAITRLQELLCIDTDPLWYQRVDKNLCGWPSLSSVALKWLLHSTQQTKMTALVKEALAALYISSTRDCDVALRQDCFHALFAPAEMGYDGQKWIVIPTAANLSFTVGTMRHQPHHSHRITHDRVINLIEEPFGVSWLEIMSLQDSIPLKITIVDSTLSQPLAISNILVVFKRIPSDGFEVLFGMHPSDMMLDEAPSPAVTAAYHPRRSSSVLMSNNPLALAEDEFACELPSNHNLTVQPGKQTIDLQLVTTVLGDFVLQRILLVCQEPMIVLACRALDNITNTAYESNSDNLGNELSNPMIDCGEVQAYFDRYPMLRILPPTEILSIDVYSGMRVPPNRFDQFIISLHINDGDQLQRLKLSIVCDSRCRRISDDYDGQPGLTLSCSPVVSYMRGGEGSSSRGNNTNRSTITAGSFDINATTPHFVEREFTVKVAAAEQWDFIWTGCEEQPACSINNKTTIEVYQVDGGSAIQLRIPFYIATKLLETTEIDEFTLQTQLQISAEGIIQKGPCVVPFSTMGSASLFCCNLLQARVMSSQYLGGLQHVQFTLFNINIVEVVVIAFVLLDSLGEVIQQSEEELNLQQLGYPEDLLYSSAVDEHEADHNSNAPHLLPSEEYCGFLSLPIGMKSVHAMRVFYRRQTDRSDLNTLLSTDLQLNLSPTLTKPLSLSGIAATVATVATAGDKLEEAQYRALVEESYHLGQMLWLKSRLQCDEGGLWSLFVDSVATLPLAEYQRVAILSSNCFLQVGTMEEVKAWFIDTSSWLSAGMMCTAADELKVYNIEFALVPTITGVLNIPPLKLLFQDEILLFPHRNSTVHKLLIGAGDEPHSILFNADN